MAVSVGDLIATLKLETAGFNQGLREATDAINRLTGVLDKGGEGVKKLGTAQQTAAGQAKQFSDEISKIPGPIGAMASATSGAIAMLTGPAGLAGAMLAVTVAAIAMVKSLADDIERLDNLAYTTGLSVQALQALEEAARRTGQAPEALAMGLARVNLEMGKVLTGSAEVNPAFAAMGVNLRALIQDGASTQDVLEQMARRIEAIPDPMMRAAVQTEIFGTRNRALAVALHEIATLGFQGYIDKVKEMGNVTSDETNKMARYFDTMFDNLKSTLRGWLQEAKALTATIFLAIGTQWTILITEMQALWLRFIAVLQSNRPTWLGGTKEAADAAIASADAARRTADAAKNLGLFGLPPGGAGGGPPAERPPPQDRILPPSPAEKQAIADRLRLDEEYIRKKAELYAKLPTMHSEQAAEDAEKFLEIGRRAVEEMNKAEEDSAARAAKVLQDRGASWTTYGGQVQQGIQIGADALAEANRAEEGHAARSAQTLRTTGAHWEVYGEDAQRGIGIGLDALATFNQAEEGHAARAAGVLGTAGTHWEVYGEETQRGIRIGQSALEEFNAAEEGHASRLAGTLTTAGSHWETYGEDVARGLKIGQDALEEFNRAEEASAARAAGAAGPGTRFEAFNDADVKRGQEIGQRIIRQYEDDLRQSFERTTAGHLEELQRQRNNLKDLLDANLISYQEYTADIEALNRAGQAVILQDQIATAHGAFGAWQAFSAGFQLEVLSWGTLMQNFARLGAETARLMTTSLSDLFFDVITGKLDDLEDVWDHFWKSMLRMILDFLASSAVSELLKFIGSLFNIGGGAGTGSIVADVLGGLLGAGGAGSGSGGGGGGAGGAAGSVASMGASAAAKYGAGYVAYQAGYPNLAAYLGYKPATAAGASVAGGAGAGAGFAAAGGYGPAVGAGHDAIATGIMGGGGAGTGAAAAGAGAQAFGGFGPAVGSGLDASAAGMGSSMASTQTGTGGGLALGGVSMATIGAVAGIAVDAAIAAYGAYTSIKSRSSRDERQAGGQLGILRDLSTGELSPASLLGSVNAIEQLQKNLGGTAKALNMSPEQAQAFLTGATGFTQQGFTRQTQQILGGQQIAPNMQSADFMNSTMNILSQAPGFNNLGQNQQQNLANMGASFEGNAEALREMVKSITEMTTGLKLTNEQADALVAKGKDATTTFEQTNVTTQELRRILLDTTNGVGDAAGEAKTMAENLAAGTIPAQDITGLIQALATEHGPAFIEQLQLAVENLGLSKEATAELLAMIQEIASTEIVIPVSYDVQGEPPGASHQTGGWVGSARDTVEPGEFVVRADVARRHGAALEALNAGGGSAAGGGTGASAEELQRWDREIAALHEIRDELRRRPGRLVGARV